MTGRSGVPIVLLIILPYEDSIKATSWRSLNSVYSVLAPQEGKRSEDFTLDFAIDCR
jgi:hypothetical protein